MDKLYQFIYEHVGLSVSLQFKMLSSLVVVLGIVLLRYVVIKVIFQNTSDVRTRYNWKKSISYFSLFLLLIFLLLIWLENFRSFGTFLGLFSAGLAIALKDLVSDFAAWLFIITRRPFTTGDRIQIGEIMGDVVDIRYFQFTLLEIGNWVHADQSTGRIVHIPNTQILTRSLFNFSKGFHYIWNEIDITLTFESDWQKAKGLLRELVYEKTEDVSDRAKEEIREASHSFMIYYQILTPTVYTRVVDYGVTLSLRFLCEPRRRRGIEEQLWEAVLLEFAKHDDIDFAYPTQRFYNNMTEGKQAKDSSFPPQA